MAVAATAVTVERELAPLPVVPLPRAPQGRAVWSRFLIVLAVLMVLFALGQLANLLMQLAGCLSLFDCAPACCAGGSSDAVGVGR